MKVLILCTGNSCRSQMAEGFLRSFDDNLDVRSAGSRPSDRVNPHAVRVMDEVGIDISDGKPQDVRELLDEPWDYVVTVCDNAKEECPVFLGDVRERLHISFPDPADATGTEDEILSVFRASRDAIRLRFREFFEQNIKS